LLAERAIANAWIAPRLIAGSDGLYPEKAPLTLWHEPRCFREIFPALGNWDSTWKKTVLAQLGNLRFLTCEIRSASDTVTAKVGRLLSAGCSDLQGDVRQTITVQYDASLHAVPSIAADCPKTAPSLVLPRWVANLRNSGHPKIRAGNPADYPSRQFSAST